MKSEEFIREIDEDLRREKMAQLWRRYGGVILGAIGLWGWVQDLLGHEVGGLADESNRPRPEHG